MKAKLKKICINLLLTVFTIVITLTGIEAGLRLYYFKSLATPTFYYLNTLFDAHPTYGWKYRPNLDINFQNLDYAVVLTTNSKGYRDIEHNYPKNPGVFRIVVLGDSFMDAYQVDFEDSLPRLLKKKLAHKNVEVINLGVRAYGTVQEFLLLENEGLKYKPDLVLLAFFPLNDICDNSRELNRLQWGEDSWRCFARPYAKLDFTNGSGSCEFPDFKRTEAYFEKKQQGMRRQLKRRSIFEKTVLYKFYELYKNSKTTGPIPPYDPNITFGTILWDFDPLVFPANKMTASGYREAWESAWETTCSLIIKIQKTSQKAGAQFVIFTVPAKVQVDKHDLNRVKEELPQLQFDPGKMNKALREFTLKNQVHYFDLLPDFEDFYRKRRGRLYHSKEDQHWNKKGHKLAAEKLVEYLEKYRLIPDSK